MRLILSHQELITHEHTKIKLGYAPSAEAFIWLQNYPKSGRNVFEIWVLGRPGGVTLGACHKNSVQNHHKKKFILRSDSGSKIGHFRPFGS